MTALLAGLSRFFKPEIAGRDNLGYITNDEQEEKSSHSKASASSKGAEGKAKGSS